MSRGIVCVLGGLGCLLFCSRVVAQEGFYDEAGDVVVEGLVDVNRAGVAELTRVPLIDRGMAERMVAFREVFGAFASVEEMAAVEGVSLELVERVKGFLVAGTPEASAGALPEVGPAWRVEALQRWSRRVETGRGYAPALDSTSTRYAGGPARQYARVRAERAAWSVNLTAERDPGETGVDFWSGHAEWSGRRGMIVAGDFEAAFGQGLVLWRGRGFGKGSEPALAMRTGSGLRGYGSTDEQRFFRGVAGRFGLSEAWTASIWASRRQLDARIEQGEVLSVGSSGLHRTPSERSQQDQLAERVDGAALTWRPAGAEVGVTGYRARWSSPWPSGHSAVWAGSVFGDASWGLATVFGEAARSASGVWGGVAGVRVRDGAVDGVVSVRHVPAAFWSPFGSVFGEGSGAGNEAGVYAGVRMRPVAAWTVAAYVDGYRFPGPRHQVRHPSEGQDALLRLDWTRGDQRVALQLRRETKEAGTVWTDHHGRETHGVIEESRRSIRLEGSQMMGPFRLRVRAERTRFSEGRAAPSDGFLLYHDLQWEPTPTFRLTGRLATFDVDAYGARVYAFENDLRYLMTSRVFTGRGRRAYLLARWACGPLTLEVKLAATWVQDADTIGSGLDETDGHRQRDIRVGARWMF